MPARDSGVLCVNFTRGSGGTAAVSFAGDEAFAGDAAFDGKTAAVGILRQGFNGVPAAAAFGKVAPLSTKVTFGMAAAFGGPPAFDAAAEAAGLPAAFGGPIGALAAAGRHAAFGGPFGAVAAAGCTFGGTWPATFGGPLGAAVSDTDAAPRVSGTADGLGSAADAKGTIFTASVACFEGTRAFLAACSEAASVFRFSCENEFRDLQTCPVTTIEFDPSVVDNYDRAELVTEVGFADPAWHHQLHPTYLRSHLSFASMPTNVRQKFPLNPARN